MACPKCGAQGGGSAGCSSCGLGQSKPTTSGGSYGGHNCSGGACFPAGTKIATPQRNRDIAKLQKGDLILAYDIKSEKVETRKILKVAFRESNIIWQLVFADGQILRTTGSHSFSVEGKWKKASQIKPGEHLESMDASGTVNQRRIAKSSSTGDIESVYNLVVEGDFTFFADGIAAHSFTYFRFVRMIAWNVYSLIQSLGQRHRLTACAEPADCKLSARTCIWLSKYCLFMLFIPVASLVALSDVAATISVIAIEGVPSPVRSENYSLSTQYPPSLNDMDRIN